MRSSLLKIPPLLTLALLGAALPASAGAAETEAVAPLPPSNYAVRPACSEARAGFASCLALQLVAVSAEAQRHTHPIGMVRRAARARPAVPSPKTGELGLRPQDLHSAYSLPTSAPGEQTIAIVDAYNDPRAEADLKTYSEEFGLPLCTAENGCFSKVSQETGEPLPFPKTVKELEEAKASPSEEAKEEAEEAAGWAVEISLDIESAHATCQSCRILLVEADSPGQRRPRRGRAAGRGARRNRDLELVGHRRAGDRSRQRRTSAVRRSGDRDHCLGGRRRLPQLGRRTRLRTQHHPVPGSLAARRLGRRHAAGAARPRRDLAGRDGLERAGAQEGAAAACASRPPPGSSRRPTGARVGCGTKRAVADVSADADPYTGLAIYDSDAPGELCETRYLEGKTEKSLPHWCTLRRHQPGLPDRRLGVRARGRRERRRAAGGNALREPPRKPRPLPRRDGRIERQMRLLQRRNRASRTARPPKRRPPAAPRRSRASRRPATTGLRASARRTASPASSRPARSHAGERSRAGRQRRRRANAPRPPRRPPRRAAPPTPTVSVQLSALGLTAPALLALSRHRPAAGRIAFSFVLNVPARLRVTLSRRVRSHGRVRWVSAAPAATVPARRRTQRQASLRRPPARRGHLPAHGHAERRQAALDPVPDPLGARERGPPAAARARRRHPPLR